MSRRVLGIDCSSKTIHVTVLDENGKIVAMQKWVANTNLADMDEKFYDLCLSFYKSVLLDTPQVKGELVLRRADNPVAVVESAVYVQNVKTSFAISQVVAGVKLSLKLLGIPCIAVDPRSWKKSCLADGTASKDKVMSFAKAKWGDVFKEQDFADAACIALWGAKRF